VVEWCGMKQVSQLHSYLFYPLTSEISELKIAEIGKFDPKCNSEIEQWDIDFSLKRPLQWYWFSSEVCVGPTLYGVKQIISIENEMNNLKNGLLCIGRGPNGDELFVDAKTLEVFFWNHETAEDYESRRKSDCEKLYDSVVSLLLHVRNQDFIPWDAFQAKSYYAMYKGL
jgi:hypothetical protein